jgi:EAL domain-containing protein (putative c-di-GMP-specific phosphodiesterase class I)
LKNAPPPLSPRSSPWAHSLRLKVIAKRHNCDQMQGYLINAPMPAAELGTILAGETRAVDVP